MHGQQNEKYTEMHGQQNDKYSEMHGQQNDKNTEMHGQQKVKKKCVDVLNNVISIFVILNLSCTLIFKYI